MTDAIESEDDAFYNALQKGWAYQLASNAADVYLLTRDGRYLWQALIELHLKGIPMPPNLYDKFAEIGHKLLAAQDDDQIARALGFKGDNKRHIGPKNSLKAELRLKVARHVEEVMRNPKFTLGRAVALVAQQRNLTPSNVKSIYHRVFTLPGSRASKAKKSGDVKTLSQVMSVWGSLPK